MDNCFALIGAHYHAITVRSTNGKTRISRTLYCRGDSFKHQLHTTHVGAVAWESHVNSPTTCMGKVEYSMYRFIFGLFLKLKKDLWCANEAFKLFCFKDTINFTLLFFLCGRQWKIPECKYDSYRLWCKWISTQWLVEDVMSTGLTNTHTHGSWILYHIFARKQCILCSELHHKCCLTLLYAGTIAHGSIRLLPRSLVSLRGCSLAITFTNMLEVPISNLSEHSCLCGHLIPLRSLSQRVLCHLFQPLLPPPVQT